MSGDDITPDMYVTKYSQLKTKTKILEAWIKILAAPFKNMCK